MVTSGIRYGRGPVRRARLLEHTRNVHRDRVGADEQRLRDVLVGFAAGEQLQDFELTRGQTGGIARESQPITFPERSKPFAQRLEAERDGYLRTLIEQRCRLDPVVASAQIQERDGIIVTGSRRVPVQSLRG